MKYSDMTIEEAEIINNFKERLLNILKKVYKVAEVIGNTIAKIITTIKEYIIKLFDKKISKKRFMKLLQSKGMQRNEINHIVKNNKDKYTLWRYFINSPPLP